MKMGRKCLRMREALRERTRGFKWATKRCDVEREQAEHLHYQYELVAGKMREEGCGEDKLAIVKLILDQLGEEEVYNAPN